MAKKKKLRPIDWGQYRLNGGSYCMAVTEDDRYCGRGAAWPGHNLEATWPNHPFVPGCPTPDDASGESK
jgi:hypothetical protein